MTDNHKVPNLAIPGGPLPVLLPVPDVSQPIGDTFSTCEKVPRVRRPQPSLLPLALGKKFASLVPRTRLY